MMFRSKKLLLLLMLLLAGLIFVSCRTGATIPRGWSSAVVSDDTLFIGSMQGTLVAFDTVDGSRLGEPVVLETSAPAGGFGCTPAARSVAIYGAPVVSGDLVYVGGYNGKIYAFTFEGDRLRTEPRWVYPRTQENLGHIVGGLVVAQGKVYFGATDGKIYALDAADGFKEWEFEIGDKIWSTPAIAGDTLFVGSFDKKLYALNAIDGSKRWEFETGGAIAATPLLDNNTVYIGSFDRYLYAVDAIDGSLKWRAMAENWFWTRPVVYGGTLYAGNLDGKVYAIDTRNGNKLVEFDLGSPLSSSPVLVGSSVIVVTEAGELYALDTETRRQRQLVDLEEKVFASLAADNKGAVYIHTAKDSLYAVDAQSGAVRQFSIK